MGKKATVDEGFSIDEATVECIQKAFKEHKLTSTKLLRLYLTEIQIHNPYLKSVIQVNPDALFQHPYGRSINPCGSSTGSAVSVAANLVAVTLGTETAGSILCPASSNSVVGFKPTVGLTSRAGVVPISLRQDSVGPICRTVADAVYVLDAIVGADGYDEATQEASAYIPQGGYLQFLKVDGLHRKRLGITNDDFLGIQSSLYLEPYEYSVNTLRRRGAVLIDNLDLIANFDELQSIFDSSSKALQAEFRGDLNAYLGRLVNSRVRSLAEIIAFNEEYYYLEKTKEHGQDTFESADKTNGIDGSIQEIISKLETYTENGFVKLMRDNELDALVTPLDNISLLLGIGGFPGIMVPAGYRSDDGTPFGICFSGLKGSEKELIQIAYDFEQATKIRKPPNFHKGVPV